MPRLADKLKDVKVAPRRTAPLWQGPTSDGPQGGVTQGLISRYLCCKERYRAHVMLGLKPQDAFNSRLEFGNMWHKCEEAHAKGGNTGPTGPLPWDEELRVYCQSLCKKYRLQQAEVEHWWNMTKALFPEYIRHWAEHPDVKNRTPLVQEQVFHVPYKLPSGRVVQLRGKWDAVDLIEEAPVGVYLQENKTKSAVDPVKLSRQLRFDLQTMTYFIALQERPPESCKLQTAKRPSPPIRGVRYNVIRRSAHKSVESMLKKLGEDQRAGRAAEWFWRARVEISAGDVERFKRETLDPVLENLCDDYEWWDWCIAAGKPANPFNDKMRRTQMPHHVPRHHSLPFGVYNVIAEGGSSDLDNWLETGSEAGLVRADDLFPELKAA